MNGLRTLKRKKHLGTCHLPLKTKASSFEGLRAPSHCSILCPTARGQVVGAQPLLNTPLPRMLIPTHHLLCDTLHEVSHSLVYQPWPQLD